jgi:dihydroorotase
LPGKGHLGIGADADLTVFDPGLEWTYDPGTSAGKSRNSPFAGWAMKGKARATIVSGTIAWQGN